MKRQPKMFKSDHQFWNHFNKSNSGQPNTKKLIKPDFELTKLDNDESIMIIEAKKLFDYQAEENILGIKD